MRKERKESRKRRKRKKIGMMRIKREEKK